MLPKTLLRLCVAVFMTVVGAALGLGIYYWNDEDAVRGLAQCGDCHCSYANSASGVCPEAPPTEFPETLLQSLLELELLNDPLGISCDPYQDEDCMTTPPLDSLDGATTDAVCAIRFETQDSARMCDSYRLETYPDVVSAQADGAFVTHRGACGLCSSLQDLVVYMRYRDLTTLGQECGTKGLTLRENGISCFQEKVGMTEGCAAIWMSNVRSTLHNCGGLCFVEDLLDQDYNGPAPTCALSECLQCDEDNSGSVFQAFAGRTRPRSGLISAIARPCETIATEIRHDLPAFCTV
jgi:hypothetical protein